MALPLSIACGLLDRTLPLHTGEIGVEGCNVSMIAVSPEEGFHRAFKHGEFDVAELSLGSYLASIATGTNRYVAIPIFLSRAFRHGIVYVRKDHVTEPAALVGSRIGVPEYQMTAAIWMKGILSDQHGIEPHAVTWVTGGVEQVGRDEKVSIELPKNIRLKKAKKPLAQCLLDGEIEALISPRQPSCFSTRYPEIGRLFENYRSAEVEYYRSTSIFPIMHVVGLRKDLLGQHPWLATSVFKAFAQAKREAVSRLSDTTSYFTMLPWINSELEVTKSLMGSDYWPYGIDGNMPTLSKFIDYAIAQGIVRHRPDVTELFANATFETAKI